MDIFISYSSKDREQAEQLTELLASAGLSVWIDQAGIEAAESWSEEIVEAIDACKAFIVMLSSASVLSHNVVKEVSLASEKRKKILPLDLEPVELPKNMQYALAGIQRAPMTNIDAVIRALAKLGLEATGAPQPPKIAKETDTRKSLMILPFEDLSPTGDNQWFADGLVGELIDMFGKIKSVQILDRKTSLDLRGVKQTTVEIGKLFNTRYFIEGSVRKFGEQIKISVSLLDIETGDHLWQESFKGVMADIFDLQESVANKVVEGLKLHLTNEEKSLLEERGTENAEAYELYAKAREYFNRRTKEGFQFAIQLTSDSIRHDPGYAEAYQYKALSLVSLYRAYDRNPGHLDEAEALCLEALRLKPNLFWGYSPLSQILLHRDKLDEAEEMAREYIRKDPKNYSSHFALGYFYMETGQYEKAIAPFEEAARIRPDNLATLGNLASISYAAGKLDKCAHWASVALPLIERQLALHPDDESSRVEHASLLISCEKKEEANAAAKKLSNLKDSRSLYNASCLLGRLGDRTEQLRMFRRAIEAGYRNIRLIKEFINGEDDGIATLAGTPEYVEVKQMVEKIEADAAEQSSRQEGKNV